MPPEPITKCTRPRGLRSKCQDAQKCWVASCGYSKLKKPNPYWKEQHGICRYEHCIENQPLTAQQTARSCPIFGHNCPGGARSAAACRAQKARLDAERSKKR